MLLVQQQRLRRTIIWRCLIEIHLWQQAKHGLETTMGRTGASHRDYLSGSEMGGGGSQTFFTSTLVTSGMLSNDSNQFKVQISNLKPVFLQFQEVTALQFS
jgi:hypothetical protein